MTVNDDKRLLALDFLCEVGDMVATAGAAIAAAAAAERYDVLELAFRQASRAISDGISELKIISPKIGELE